MIKVLVVDDSALIRSLLGEIIKRQSDMQLIGPAQDAYVARELVNQHSPDVITLDIEMTKVDGLTFLDRLMKARPTPVVMISTLTEKGAEATLRALELGAVDFIPKPKLNVANAIDEYQEIILGKIREASRARIKKAERSRNVSRTHVLNQISGTEKIIAIGASTGGTEAIKDVLVDMPANSPAIVIVQHMPAGFTTTYAARLDKLSKVQVKEAEDGERILPGHAYLAPGGLHLEVIKSGANYCVRLTDTELVSGHKPSVDVMMSSIAKIGAKNCIAMILTGMGKDGAQGLLEIRQSGGYTLAQDEKSCVVYGMPKEANLRDAVCRNLPLQEISKVVVEHLNSLGGTSRL